MDIYKYIPSKDVVGHLKSIDYRFSLIQLVRIIGYRRKQIPLKQVHDDLREIMTMYEDQKLTSYASETLGHEKPSLFRLIKEYIKHEEKLLDEFFKADGLYEYETAAIFSSFDDFAAYFNGEGAPDDDDVYLITKRHIGDNVVTDIKTNRKLEPLKVEKYDTLDGLTYIEDFKTYPKFYDLMPEVYEAIPLPFENGDIVYDVLDEEKRPLLIYDEYYEKICRGEEYSRLYDLYDPEFINCFRYEKGRIFWDHKEPVTLARYTGEETEEYKTLKLLQSFIRGNVDLQSFLPAYHAALDRMQNRRNEEYYGQEYLDHFVNGTETNYESKIKER